jgi:hypothetical protein
VYFTGGVAVELVIEDLVARELEVATELLVDCCVESDAETAGQYQL